MSRRSGTETTVISLSLPNIMVDKLKEEMDKRMLNSLQEVIRSILGDYFSGEMLIDMARTILRKLKE